MSFLDEQDRDVEAARMLSVLPFLCSSCRVFFQIVLRHLERRFQRSISLEGQLQAFYWQTRYYKYADGHRWACSGAVNRL